MRTRLYMKDITKDKDGIEIKTTVFGDEIEAVNMACAFIIGHAVEYDIPIDNILETMKENYESCKTQIEEGDE